MPFFKLLVFITVFTISNSCFSITIIRSSKQIVMTPSDLKALNVCLEIRERLLGPPKAESVVTYDVGIAIPENIDDLSLYQVKFNFSRDINDLAEITFYPKSRNGRSYVTFEINEAMFKKSMLNFHYSGGENSRSYSLKLNDFKENYLIDSANPSYNSYRCYN